ncbi:MAG: hypothetical protein AAF267_11625 [Deinococcota bacterium]
MDVTLLPLMGPLHVKYPQYNAVTIRDLADASTPEALVLTSLTADAFDDPRWQDTDDVALPLAVVPWARKVGLTMHCVGEPSPDPNAYADFQRYMDEYPQAKAQLDSVNLQLRPLQMMLDEPLTLARIQTEVLPQVQIYAEAREKALGDGPGTDWLRQRSKVMAVRIADLPHTRVTALVNSDVLPFVQAELEAKVTLLALPPPQPSEDAETRAFLDFAFRSEIPEPGNAILRLQQIGTPEARFHEGNLRFAYGQLEEAKACLEIASRENFSEPYYLPGYLLARLGQLADLCGERDAAKRAYKGVRALSYAPKDALEVAEAGLARPFTLPES